MLLLRRELLGGQRSFVTPLAFTRKARGCANLFHGQNPSLNYRGTLPTPASTNLSSLSKDRPPIASGYKRNGPARSPGSPPDKFGSNSRGGLIPSKSKDGLRELVYIALCGLSRTLKADCTGHYHARLPPSLDSRTTFFKFVTGFISPESTWGS